MIEILFRGGAVIALVAATIAVTAIALTPRANKRPSVLLIMAYLLGVALMFLMSWVLAVGGLGDG